MESVNLDDHTAYLNAIQRDKSLYPYRNVMSGEWLIALLEKHAQKEKADKVQAVIDKGLNSYAPTGLLSPSAPAIKPKYFTQVIQKSTGKIIDWWDGVHGEDQNIGLHDLVSQLSMRWVNTKQGITVNLHAQGDY